MIIDKYIFFYRTKDVFSQWYPCNFIISNNLFNCAEQWMMYSKALLFEDKETAFQLLETKEPRMQKELGRKVRNFDVSIWNSKAKNIVYKGNYAKFNQNEHLKKILLSTGNKILVEASPYDAIWGVGMSEDNPDIYDSKKWKGTNWLGEVLMQVREDLSKELNKRLS
jgi:ribA/ribD-fused uncharacterized protein